MRNQNLIVLVFGFLGLTVYGQNKAPSNYDKTCWSFNVHHYGWPARWHLYHKAMLNNVAVEYGTITFKNNDSVSGLLSFYKQYGRFTDVAILPDNEIATGSSGYLQTFYGGDEAELYEKGETTTIKSFRIYKDSVNKQCYADFVAFVRPYEFPNYWRVLAAKDDVKIADKFWFRLTWRRNEYLNGQESVMPEAGRQLILITKSEVVKIRRGLYARWQAALKRFIKKRYSVDITEQQFNTTHDILTYILDKEVEKQRAENK